MKIIKIKIIKYIFGWGFSLAFIFSFFMALNAHYNPTDLVITVLWYVLYPILVITFFCLLYLKKDAHIRRQRMRENALKMSEKKWLVKVLVPSMVLFLPAILVYMLNAYLGLAGIFLASRSFSESVTVVHVDCDHSRRVSKLSLEVVGEKGNKFRADFSYNICRDYPNIRRLDGQSIELNGRRWVLGVVYDSFSCSREIDLT